MRLRDTRAEVSVTVCVRSSTRSEVGAVSSAGVEARPRWAAIVRQLSEAGSMRIASFHARSAGVDVDVRRLMGNHSRRLTSGGMLCAAGQLRTRRWF